MDQGLTVDGAVTGRAVVAGRELVMFGSNDYLGLGAHPKVVERARQALARHGAGIGMNAVVGLTRTHLRLMETLADFLGCEDVALTNSCTAANCATVPTLVGAGDEVLSDELNHASIIDACRLSRARTVVYSHNSSQELSERLASVPDRSRVAVVSDGVFSMEGTRGNIPEILSAADARNATVVVDESHAVGVLGPRGRGTLEHFGIATSRCIQTGTFAKALGAGAGGYVAGPRPLIDEVRRSGRFFIFTSTLPAVVAAAALAAIELIFDDQEQLERLRHNTHYLRSTLHSMGVPISGDDESPIVPIIVGDDQRALDVASILRDNGIYAPAFVSPIVPAGTARLRVQISGAHTQTDLDRLVASFDQTNLTA